jgi:competence protein CoiA
MRYALIDGQREDPQPNRSGECPSCGSQMIAKCGELKVWHWAHFGKRVCDPWWENETEWHRDWKGNFPSDWQEYVHVANDGERHIADVKTDRDWVIEFQHSYLKPEERRARNAFYKKLVWVVDGNRRPKYRAQFFKALDEMNPIYSNPTVRKVFLAWSQLLQEWVDPQAPVFFDFGEESPLWCLIPSNPDMWVHVAAISRKEFVELHLNATEKKFADYIKRLTDIVSNDGYRRAQIQNQAPLHIPSNLQRQLFRQARARSLRRL